MKYLGENFINKIVNWIKGREVWTSGTRENSVITVACKNSIGSDTTKGALGAYSCAEGFKTTASGVHSHAEGYCTTANGADSHAEGYETSTDVMGTRSHAEGCFTIASGNSSHAEGYKTIASGYGSHAEGFFNVEDEYSVHSVGIGTDFTRKNAEYIYVDANNNLFNPDPKNGYKYLIGVGGYDGISTDTSTYKSVQEVIADLTARIEQLETKVKALEDANTPA